MTPRHHPSEATILAYASGALGEALSLVVASHLAFCSQCRAAVAEGEAMGGMLLDDIPPAELSAGSWDRMLALIERPPATRPAPPPPALDPECPAPLARYLKDGLAHVAWRRLGPGLRQFELVPHALLTGGNLRLLRIGPGKSLPRHGHRGTELTLVLAGSFSDELGEFARGDVAETDTEIVHQPASGTREDCICLIATEAPLRFDSFLARMAQRFTGM